MSTTADWLNAAVVNLRKAYASTTAPALRAWLLDTIAQLDTEIQLLEDVRDDCVHGVGWGDCAQCRERALFASHEELVAGGFTHLSEEG